MMKTTLVAGAWTFMLSVAVTSLAQAQDCEYQRDYDIELDAAQIQALEIDAEAGPIEIRGQGSDAIQITARACASSEDALDGVTLQYERRGDRWEIISETEVNDGWFFSWTRDSYAYLEMTVVAPNGVSLDVDDGSGSLLIADWEGDIDIDDGSGSIELSRIMGSVDIDDGSGSIHLAEGEGDVDLEDGSGDIDIHNWTGNLFLNDGSGDMNITQVVGHVTVDDDGSGPISIEDIDGDVRIDEDGSGSIDVYRVTGDLSIGSAGSGGLHFNDIDGNVSM